MKGQHSNRNITVFFQNIGRIKKTPREQSQPSEYSISWWAQASISMSKFMAPASSPEDSDSLIVVSRWRFLGEECFVCNGWFFSRFWLWLSWPNFKRTRSMWFQIIHARVKCITNVISSQIQFLTTQVSLDPEDVHILLIYVLPQSQEGSKAQFGCRG